MRYGKAIGARFYEDGSPRRFPGNTVVADVTPEVSAYPVLNAIRRRLEEEGYGNELILMPGESYHMTFLQGINDQNRTPDRWPVALPLDASMREADAFFQNAVLRAGLPGRVKMKFNSIGLSENCVIIRLDPADEEQNRILRSFRDRAATQLGHFIPGHDSYRFHITLAYVRVVPEGERAQRLREILDEAERRIRLEKPFFTTEPYIAFFSDMLSFPKKRRD